jgi:hypothetical protein
MPEDGYHGEYLADYAREIIANLSPLKPMIF